METCRGKAEMWLVKEQAVAAETMQLCRSSELAEIQATLKDEVEGGVRVRKVFIAEKVRVKEAAELLVLSTELIVKMIDQGISGKLIWILS